MGGVNQRFRHKVALLNRWVESFYSVGPFVSCTLSMLTNEAAFLYKEVAKIGWYRGSHKLFAPYN